MAQWLLALAALPEDLHLIPSTHMAAHNHLGTFVLERDQQTPDHCGNKVGEVEKERPS